MNESSEKRENRQTTDIYPTRALFWPSSRNPYETAINYYCGQNTEETIEEATQAGKVIPRGSQEFV
jgi:hypothetical protein